MIQGRGASVAGESADLATRLRVTVSGPELFVGRTVELLRGMGFDARRAPSVNGLGAFRRRIAKIRIGAATDVFLDIYGARGFDRLQGPLARIGVPTLMLWVGSDVVKAAPEASRAVIEQAWHWCVAPWLQDELAEAGIAAEVVRITPPRVPDVVPAFPPTFGVLSYVLDGRDDLYGRDFILELARRRPEIRFILLGAVPTDPLPANVTALGWVSDTDSIMTQTTIYLRPASHDGLSNLVLEALAHGRHVLWTHPFPGVEVVNTVDAAEARIDELRRQHAAGRLPLNLEGRHAVIEMFDPSAVAHDISRGLVAIAEQRWRRPPGRFHRSIGRLILMGLRVVFRPNNIWATIVRGLRAEDPSLPAARV